MRRNFRKRSGVIIDRCHQHGTWLDAHELEQIAGFVLSGRAERAARVEAELNAARDEKRVRESVLRVRGISSETQAEYTIFGERKSTSTVGTIFDLLLGILN
jgi:Zn-finger nucleic acid-binding protein